MMGRFVAGETRRAGGHHGDRGRSRRAQRIGDGDLRRRPIRDLPAASAPWPDRTRRPPAHLLLISGSGEDSLARARLDAVASTRDGFALAEIDLEQRREGNVLGAEQSGERSSLRLLRVLADAELITSARGLAERCVAGPDPELSDAGLADAVTMVELQAAGEWLDRT